MTKFYVVKIQKLYSDGRSYWDQVKAYRDKEKAIQYAETHGGHHRVFEEDFDD